MGFKHLDLSQITYEFIQIINNKQFKKLRQKKYST